MAKQGRRKKCDYANEIAYDSKIDHIISVRSNRIVGMMGKCMDDILCSVEKRKCQIIGEIHLGSKLPNGTYTGVLGLLQSGKGDLYLKGEPEMLIDEPFATRGLPLRAENLWATQSIQEEEENFGYFDMIENFKFSSEIYLSFFSSLISFGLICFGLFRLKMRSNDNFLNRNLLSKFFYISNYLARCNEFSFKSILLSFSLFLWFTLLFVCNVIKTNAVVVDTSYLVKNKEEIMNFRLVCFFKDDTAYNLAINSPENSFLFKLLNEKTKLDDKKHAKEKMMLKNTRCLITGKDIEFSKLKIIMVYTEIEALGVGIFMSQLNFVKKIWALKKVYEYNTVFYQRPGKKIKESIIAEQIAYDDLEHGMSKNMYKCMEDNSENFIEKTMKIYGDINEIIDDYTGFSNLEFNNFRSLFIIYFSFLIFIFIIFSFSRIVSFYYSKNFWNYRNCCLR